MRAKKDDPPPTADAPAAAPVRSLAIPGVIDSDDDDDAPPAAPRIASAEQRIIPAPPPARSLPLLDVIALDNSGEMAQPQKFSLRLG